MYNTMLEVGKAHVRVLERCKGMGPECVELCHMVAVRTEDVEGVVGRVVVAEDGERTTGASGLEGILRNHLRYFWVSHSRPQRGGGKRDLRRNQEEAEEDNGRMVTGVSLARWERGGVGRGDGLRLARYGREGASRADRRAGGETRLALLGRYRR